METRLRTNPLPLDTVVVKEFRHRKSDFWRRYRAADNTRELKRKPLFVKLVLVALCIAVYHRMRIILFTRQTPFERRIA